jgi:hypothetical protein
MKATVVRREVEVSLDAQQAAAPVDAAGFVAITRQLEESRNKFNELTRWQLKFERNEKTWRGEVERAEKRIKAGMRDVDLDGAQRVFLAAREETGRHEALIAEAGAEVVKLEESIVTIAKLVPTLESEIKRLESKSEELQHSFELAFLKQLTGAKMNGSMEETRTAMQANKQTIEAINKAIAIATGVIRWEKTKAAIKAALPGLEELVAQQTKGFELAQEAGEGIAAEMDRLRKEHNYDFPGGFPARDWTGFQKEAIAAINRIKQEVVNE